MRSGDSGDSGGACLQAVLGALEALHLEHVPKEMVDQVLLDPSNRGDFETDELSVLTDHISLPVLKDLVTKLRALLNHPATKGNQHQTTDRCLWTFMTGRKFASQTLLAVLCHLCQSNKPRGTMAVSLVAADVYLLLLRVPGSIAYHFFHPLLFRSVLNLLKACAAQQGGKVSNSKRKAAASRSRGTKKTASKLDINDSEGEMDDEHEHKETINEEELLLQVKWVAKLVDDLTSLLEDDFTLEQDIFDYSLEVVVGLTRMTDTSPVKQKKRGKTLENGGGEQKVVEQAFDTLHRLLQPYVRLLRDPKSCPQVDQEAYKLLLRNIFKNLLPNLLMSYESGTTGNASSKQKLNSRDRTIAFLRSLIDQVSDSQHNASSPSSSEGQQQCLQEEFYSCVHALLQHTCTNVPEKAEQRTHAAVAVRELFCALPIGQRPRFIRFLLRYARNAKVVYRLFAVQIAFELLPQEQDEEAEMEREIVMATEQARAKQEAEASTLALLEIILQRANDKIATVRAKALSNFGLVLERMEKVPILRRNVESLVTTEANSRMRQRRGGHRRPDVGDQAGDANNKTDLLDLLKRRALDEKCNVRKSAIQLLEVLGLSQEELLLGAAEIRFLGERCEDPSVSIRKQAMISLGNLMRRHPSHPLLYKTWLQTVLPMIADAEATIQERCLDEVEAIILSRLIHSTNKNSSSYDANAVGGSVWLLLNHIDSETERYLERICHLLERQKRLSKSLVDTLQKAIQQPSASTSSAAAVQGGWMLLQHVAATASCRSRISPTLIFECYCKAIGLQQQEEEEVEHSQQSSPPQPQQQQLVRILEVLQQVAHRLTTAQARLLLADLTLHLKSFNQPPLLVQAMIQTTKTLLLDAAHSTANERERNQRLHDWASQLLTICDQHISAYVLPPQKLQLDKMDYGFSPSSSPVNAANPSSSEQNESGGSSAELSAESVICHLFTLGEVSQLCPKAVPKRLVTVVQALVAQTLPLSAAGNDDGNGEGPQQRQRIIPSSVRGYALVTLGKLCLEDEALAKRSVPAFARELETSPSPVVRNNVIVIMCDLCIRYTSLVDRYVPNLAGCIRDPSELVRRQTLLLLSRLLQEDYVKWKGTLFYRFVVALVDESHSVRQFAHFCLHNFSTTKNAGNMFFNHFIDTIFHLNGCKQHPTYNQVPQNAKEQERFSFIGPTNKRKRHAIYKTLLRSFTEEQKFNTIHKLCQDVLGGVVDGVLNVSSIIGDSPSALTTTNAAMDVVADSLEILMSKDIKVTPTSFVGGVPGKAAATEDEEDAELQVQDEERNKALAEAKGKLISQLTRKNVIENIVPILIHLKHLFEQQRSPLLGPLMQYLADLMKDYKHEIDDIMVADKQLAKELSYDLRQQQQRKKRLSLQAMSPLPLPSSPSPAASRRSSLSRATLSPRISRIAASPYHPATATAVGEEREQTRRRLSVVSSLMPAPSTPISKPSESSRATESGFSVPRLRATPSSSSSSNTPLLPSTRSRSTTPPSILVSASSPSAPATPSSTADIVLPSPFRTREQANSPYGGPATPSRVWGVEVPVALTPTSKMPHRESRGRIPQQPLQLQQNEEGSEEEENSQPFRTPSAAGAQPKKRKRIAKRRNTTRKALANTQSVSISSVPVAAPTKAKRIVKRKKHTN
ncbi:Condensin-2 complex subunit D3 [Balamuthia mandrillaris]